MPSRPYGRRDGARQRATELEERLSGATEGELPADVLEYRQLLETAEDERGGLAAERDRLAADLEIQNERARDLQAQVEQLQHGLDKAARSGSSRVATTRGGDVFERLWPRLVLHEDAKAYLVDVRTCARPQMVGHVLSQLDRGEAVPLKRFRATEHVLEVNAHIRIDATGRDRGRVYVRRLGDGRLWVYIDRKDDPKHQTAFARRIDGLPEPESETL
ncbi:hypothetical protein J1G44_06215 [Cellulomonas sp. zg-ZUI199]|uniref:Uncharacterized protein n=1 Tax=Cellulomonas wangleii TaxID=2816956 RepID=A0ABX8D3S8_9CELL|nr:MULTISPECIES: hypothetical protein [Cellulomonas]MBO0898922.1 hypothetical protein [Cellulomonas sp. zg-ZUI22]MBO0923791.1 hypothetical protein [Cellulomonas wangleii]MBO0924073.1 hypothetical protein [Cellulomonas wangleii]QVI62098.1 hypothetical protein KG103_17060 [Cellulomonas wangleii]